MNEKIFFVEKNLPKSNFQISTSCASTCCRRVVSPVRSSSTFGDWKTFRRKTKPSFRYSSTTWSGLGWWCRDYIASYLCDYILFGKTRDFEDSENFENYKIWKKLKFGKILVILNVSKLFECKFSSFSILCLFKYITKNASFFSISKIPLKSA